MWYIMKNIFFVSILCVLFFGCGDTSHKTSSTSSSGLASVYFPLQVGNRWTYVVTSWKTNDTLDTYTISVDTCKEIKGKMYYKVSHSSHRLERPYIDAYFRNDSGKVYYFSNNKEEIFIDFENNDFFKNHNFNVKDDDTLVTKVGIFTHIKFIDFPASAFYGEPLNLYAPTIGLVAINLIGCNHELIHAKIGNKVYNEGSFINVK